MSRILVCGSRDWSDIDHITDVLKLLIKNGKRPEDIMIVHGNARGADLLAKTAAEALGMETESHPADWDRYGTSAGFRRNLDMLNSGVDGVIAFQLHGSRGTQHTIDNARNMGLQVCVFTK